MTEDNLKKEKRILEGMISECFETNRELNSNDYLNMLRLNTLLHKELELKDKEIEKLKNGDFNMNTDELNYNKAVEDANLYDEQIEKLSAEIKAKNEDLQELYNIRAATEREIVDYLNTYERDTLVFNDECVDDETGYFETYVDAQ